MHFSAGIKPLLKHVISLLVRVAPAFCLLLAPGAVASGGESRAPAQILILHSYSQEYPWTKYQHQGFTEHLYANQTPAPAISTEHLDTKRIPFSETYREQFAGYLASKYANYRPDLIYVTDDNALTLARTHFPRLFPDAPIIFSGVNDYDVERQLDPTRITGVYERKDIAPNIQVLRTMSREVSDILVVGDGSSTYHSIEREIRQALKDYPEITATYLANERVDELIAGLTGRKEKYLFLTTLGGVSDASGRTLSLDETISTIGSTGNFVTLSMEDAYLRAGVVGGYVTSGTKQGTVAAQMAHRYINGIPIAQIHPVKESPNEYMFDQLALDKHGLRLPQHILNIATIRNAPDTFYQRHRTLILGLLFALAGLLFISMALFAMIVSIKTRQLRANSEQFAAQADSLRRVKDSLSAAQQIARLGSWEWDLTSQSMYWSDQEFRIFGEPPQSFSPTYDLYLSYVIPEDRSKAKTALEDAFAHRGPLEIELRILRKDGEIAHIRELGHIRFNDIGAAISIVGTTLDITTIKQHEAQEQERFRRIERYQDALLEWSRVDYKNLDEALARATEISAHTLQVGRVSIWLYDQDRSALECQLLYRLDGGLTKIDAVLHEREFPEYFRAIENGKLLAANDARTDSRTKAFTEGYLEPLGITSLLDAPIFYQGEVVGVVCHEQIGPARDWSSYEQEFASAISKSVSLSLEINRRKEIERQLEYQAYHDRLTNLPNRSLFLDRLEQAIKQAKRTGTHLAVLFLDLDNFKEINDSLGHGAGDKVLVHIAEKLRSELREVDTVARLGGDEFTVIIDAVSDTRKLQSLAMDLAKTIQKPIVIDANELYVTSSIGISTYPSDGETAEELLRNADAAMYRAKDEGRNSFQFYTEDMTEQAFERILLETSLRRALEREEFVVYYQPQFDLRTNSLIGMEALSRWMHPEMGMVPPSQFIPAAEETGLIVQVDRWVMNTALTQIGRWYEAGLEPGRLALNLAVKQLYQNDLLTTIQDTLTRTNCRPEWLALEVTESQIMRKPERAIEILRRLSECGVEIAIDDFGTGHSSLSYLKRLPVDKLKIDKSFVRDIPDDEDDVAIVRAVIALAASMKLTVIAEGVETEQQKAFLAREGCAQVQGYFYGRPVPAAEMEQLLAGYVANARATRSN